MKPDDAARLNRISNLKVTLLFTYSGIQDQRIEPYPSSVAAASLSIAPYQPERSAAGSLIEQAKGSLPADPLAELRAGGYVEELLERPGPMNDDERNKLRERYRWEVVGPNPL